jgi:hypothetical protein
MFTTYYSSIQFDGQGTANPILEPCSDTVEGRFRVADVPLTMAHLVPTLGMFDVGGAEANGSYYRSRKTNAVVWLKPDCEINVDKLVEAIETDNPYGLEPYFAIIDYAVAQRIPCVLHDSETCRKTWRP